MKISREKSSDNHDRMLVEAARLFRERGLSGVGVDALARAAGLTHGSLYSQFGSKERLAAAALTQALAGSARKMDGIDDLADYLAQYLSLQHRDNLGTGCAIAALGAEVPRQGSAVRQVFTEGVRRVIGRLSDLVRPGTPRQREDEAIAVLATMIGALILARCVDDADLSGRILDISRNRLTEPAA